MLLCCFAIGGAKMVGIEFRFEQSSLKCPGNLISKNETHPRFWPERAYRAQKKGGKARNENFSIVGVLNMFGEPRCKISRQSEEWKCPNKKVGIHKKRMSTGTTRHTAYL